ncbi:MAG: helix-turn-helix domain-containing protein [Candidatus Dormibacteria bacterium]
MSETRLLGDGQPTLAAEARARARARILSAALELLARRGFDTTVDEVAATAGVSRRTVFRHFESQAQLLAAASVEVARAVEESMPAPPAPETELDVWLLETLVTFHRLQARVVGEAFWGIHRRLPGWQTGAEGTNAPTVRRLRGDVPARIALMAWTHAGGRGDPPTWVVDAFSLLTSSFAGKGLSVPVPRSPEETGRISARILSSVIRAAIAEELAPLHAPGPA